MQIWNWHGFFIYLTNRYIFEGAVTTLWLTAFSICAGFVLGGALALMKRSRHQIVSLPARFYVWFFRGTPLLVQLIVIYTGLPKFGIRLDVVTCSLIGLSLNEAAYLAEIIRAGLNAVPPGQIAAARALGFEERQIAWRITFPQAMRIIVPPLGNSVNGLLKTTSVTSVISMEELLRRTQLLVQEHFMVLELFSVSALYYLAMTSAWDMVQRRLEHYVNKPYARPTSSRANAPANAQALPDIGQDAR
ncbi:amino acid ABC transporter permease [Komagataeibacter xylinus]|uniref:Glutamate/aspartate import permease protein GltK n=1 Tax=Komagataeibacter xylinus TaxID=28448 RepID=A0A318PL41_KOMXY|nr:amino acid ABC transporter permease [Komagataeibacter xylinus]PYD56733.1 amino acid ABC transporter permease [Komagataeibacter xylinus]GBQ74067.1 amino acid ABC transporter permease [Komagataeibacter xylinus NBRC 15237]